MSSGYRLLIVALGLILANPSYGQNIKSNQSPANSDSKAQLERIASAIEKQPVASAPDGGCKPGQDERQSDLCAQWKAADAAAESAKWTFWSLIAGVIGVGLGFGTLLAAWSAAHWAKKAAEHTETAANSASNANNIAQDSSRAWVVCDDISLRYPAINRPPHVPEGRYEFSAWISLKNVGVGLARDVRVHVDVVSAQSVNFEPAWASLKQRTEKRFQDHAMPKRKLGMPIAPGQTVKQMFAWGGPIEGHPTLEEVLHGSFYFIGYLDYIDHFGRTQNARFAFHPDADSVRPWDGSALIRAGNIGDAT